MKSFTILRYYQQAFTLGAMFFDDIPLVNTFELPWVNNEHSLSCFPKGFYEARLVLSPKHGICYEFKDVPGRDKIQMHTGNYMADTLGCVLVGKYHGLVWQGKPWARTSSVGIIDSKAAFKQFMAAAGKDKEIIVNVIGANDGIK